MGLTPYHSTQEKQEIEVCVDFRELNRATLRDYFPLHFIDRVLDTLSEK